jgi:hypothetical protein
MESLAKGIDPDIAMKELDRIEADYGSLTPENLLDASRSKKSVFYKLFLWDDEKAAIQYRLQQARNIINNVEVVIISSGEPRTVAVFESVVKDDKRVYKNVQRMDANDVEYVRNAVRKEIAHLKNKLAIYQSFNQTVLHLDKALSSLN